MANLSRSWRSLLGQQAVTTGRGITPEQAAALRRGELEANYNISGEAEDRALRRKQVEEGLRLQEVGINNAGSMFERQMAAREEEFAKTSGLSEQQFAEQKAQNAEQNRIARENMDKSSSAATTSGYIQAAAALPMAYMAANKFFGKPDAETRWRNIEAQNKIDAYNASKTPQAIAPVSTPPFDYSKYGYDPNTQIQDFNYSDYADFGYGYYDYGGYDYPYYDYSYDYGGTNVDYNFFNDTSYDWGGTWDFLGW